MCYHSQPQTSTDADRSRRHPGEMKVMIMLLIGVAIVPSYVVFMLSRRKEHLDFQHQFDLLSSRITTSFLEHLNVNFRAVSGISIAISTLYQASERPRPEFTVPNFELLARSFRVTGTSRITWSPLIRRKEEAQTKRVIAFELFPSCTQALNNARPDASNITMTTTSCSSNEDRRIPSSSESPAFSSPVWQIVSVADEKTIHYDQMLDPCRRDALERMIHSRQTVVTRTCLSGLVDRLHGPRAMMFHPVFDSLQMGNVVGSIGLELDWEAFLQALLPSHGDGLVFVLDSNYGPAMTFQSSSGKINFVGEGDLHNIELDAKARTLSSVPLDNVGHLANTEGHEWNMESSPYRVQIYTSRQFKNRYNQRTVAYSLTCVISAAVSVAIFIVSFVIGKRKCRAVFDLLLPPSRRVRLPCSFAFRSVFVKIERRQDRFPLRRGESCPVVVNGAQMSASCLPVCLESPKNQLKSYLSNPPSLCTPIMADGEPIADLFPNTTILHADISGFTAWSSEREPPQLFSLLETVYSAFDEIAKRMGVFKVETIGDCYVAATGLLEPQKDHAVIMVEFARECINHLRELTAALESSLGPSTSNLALRVGVDSGPVTAGILRGERSRLQLFGETMNTASRLESTARVNMIHVSQATHDLLVAAGKSSWLKSREGLVSTKGKGHMQTYWVKTAEAALLRPPLKTHRSSLGPLTQESEPHRISRRSLSPNPEGWGDSQIDSILSVKAGAAELPDRLVDWNADLLLGLLQKIVARRNSVSPNSKMGTGTLRNSIASDDEIEDKHAAVLPCIPLEEVSESLTMPPFCQVAASDSTNPDSLELGENIRNQLWDFVAQIASMYRENAFHNFEHASHVAMSARKLMKRIIKPDDIDYHQEFSTEQHRQVALGEEIHNCSLGISSDPWMQFAVVFAALVHDVDHTGVTNAQLIEEGNPIATTYKAQCIAEQHSIHVAWKLLMQDQFSELRSCIYANDHERDRFRKLVVNAVIATDIADKQLQTWRKNRWDKAFHSPDDDEMMTTLSKEHLINYKATIVFEYIIQASDVAHTMQHWKVYIKWNERLFQERSAAFRARRASEDPSKRWFRDEIWFFDNYIIPLAKKLKECGVFGVSSDEYLNYALANRREWEAKGEEIVQTWVLKAQRRNSMRTMQQRRRSFTAISA